VPLIVDDMISTGGTIAAAFHALQEAGAAAEAVLVVASHGLFVGPAVTRLRELPLQRVVVTDSVVSTITTEIPLQRESLQTLLAEVIRRLHGHESLEDLLVHR
jgi:ribose-phosphate pyrophosphokinase